VFWYFYTTIITTPQPVKRSIHMYTTTKMIIWFNDIFILFFFAPMKNLSSHVWTCSFQTNILERCFSYTPFKNRGTTAMWDICKFFPLIFQFRPCWKIQQCHSVNRTYQCKHWDYRGKTMFPLKAFVLVQCGLSQKHQEFNIQISYTYIPICFQKYCHR